MICYTLCNSPLHDSPLEQKCGGTLKLRSFFSHINTSYHVKESFQPNAKADGCSTIISHILFQRWASENEHYINYTTNLRKIKWTHRASQTGNRASQQGYNNFTLVLVFSSMNGQIIFHAVRKSLGACTINNFPNLSGQQSYKMKAYQQTWLWLGSLKSSSDFLENEYTIPEEQREPLHMHGYHYQNIPIH